MSFPQVTIVLARCCHQRQGFGIRFEENAGSQWIGDWAFAIREALAKKEGYDRGEVTGVFSFDIYYPGCPYCHANGIFKCGCGKVACWDGERLTVTCPWCGGTGQLSGQIESLSVGGDR